MKELLPTAGQSCLKFCKQNCMLLFVETGLPYLSEQKYCNIHVSFVSQVFVTNGKLAWKILALVLSW